MKKISSLVIASVCLAVAAVAFVGCDAPKKEAAKEEAPAASAPAPTPAPETPPAPEAHKN